MKIRILHLFAILAWISLSSFAGLPALRPGHFSANGLNTLPPQIQKAKQPSDPWRTVDSLVNLGQPRSALLVVGRIYDQAKLDKDAPQLIKAIIYRIRIQSDFQEGFLNHSIRELQGEIRRSEEPVTSVLHSILAEIYQNYYRNNQWRFTDRSRVEQMTSDSIETWDLNTITEAITNEYLLSITNEEVLKTIAIERYNAILDTGSTAVFKTMHKKGSVIPDPNVLYPTLYDFLANRALEYFTTSQGPVNQPARLFRIDQPRYFGSTDQFIRITAGPAGINPYFLPWDSISMNLLAFRIYQRLAAFHSDDKDPSALINTELDRLKFFWEKTTLSDKDSLYREGLKTLEAAHSAHPSSARVVFALAGFLNEKGQQYNPLRSEDHKWDCKAALDLCEAAIKEFPESDGAKNCRILANTMKESSLQITAEAAIPPGQPSLIKVDVKNVNTLYFRVVRTDPDDFRTRQEKSDQKEISRYLASLKPSHSWSSNIPNDGDLQRHSAELPVPALDKGFHVILCSTEKTFADPSKTIAFAAFWSTGISYVNKRNPDGSSDWFVLDRETGLPLKNVRAEAWNIRYDYPARKNIREKTGEFTTDDQGFFRFPPSGDNSRFNNYVFKFFHGDDLVYTDNFYRNPLQARHQRTHLQTMFYTDRAIYRPGQPVYFKGIILERNGEATAIKPNQSTRVIFNDVNGQRIGEQTFTTNEFGSFNGTFTIPTGRLTGNMIISNESGSVSVSVEEYKRPTFEILTNPVSGNFRLGEEVRMTGKALNFAGNPVAGAQVAYRVIRTGRFPFRDRYWYWPVNPGPEAEIISATALTDSNGCFRIGFTAFPDPEIEKRSNPVFDFTISIDVTDLNGETQSVRQVVTIGYVSLLLGHNLGDKVNLSGDTLLRISSTNLNGKFTPTLVNIKLERLLQPGRPYKSRMWGTPDLVVMNREDFRKQFPFDIFGREDDPTTWEQTETLFDKTIDSSADSLVRITTLLRKHPDFNSGNSVMIKEPGSYLLTMEATDPFGEKVISKHIFTAFNPGSREVPYPTFNWFVPLKTSGEPGETARFMIGSKENNVNVIYEIRYRDTLIAREFLKINNRAMILEIPITEKFRGNFSVNFMFVKHNRVFQNTQLITVPYTNKKLGIAFETFRGILEPGAKEAWKISVTRSDGFPAGVEMLAAMYDASLDQFRSNEWSFNIYQRFHGVSPWDVDNSFRVISGFLNHMRSSEESYIDIPGIRLNWFGLSYFGGYYRDRLSRTGMGGPEVMMAESKGSVLKEGIPPVPENQAVLNDETVEGSETEQTEDPGTERTPAVTTQALQVRTNFNETAFFYPSLVTDSSGNLYLSFTMPESLTRWKLMGLAHTRSLDFGQFEKELVTRKELMVFPNWPRFFRQSDTVVLSIKVVNLSAKDITVTMSLEMVNAITRQLLDSILVMPAGAETGNRLPGPATKQEILIPGNQSKQLSWTLAIPLAADLSMMQCRVTARSEHFSDGEERLIPVLTNRIMVTESMPMAVKGKTSAEFTFDKLIGSVKNATGSLKNYRLTLEFASNPAWYAIQALPSLNDRRYNSADGVFNAFYSNSLAAFIVNYNPAVKNVFESWKNQTPDALLSNLEKNESLKSATLAETPWVMDAGNESAQKRKLGLYFDLNTLESNLRDNLAKLQKLQTPSGGWTWFEGMPESRWISQEIITGLGRLDHLGISDIRKNPDIMNMVMNGIRYLDEEVTKDYNRLKSIEKINLDDNHLSVSQVQYLYARSFFMARNAGKAPLPLTPESEAFQYYKKQASVYWMKQERYAQGMIALALARLGNAEVPKLIVKSLSEKALHSEEMGMYWAAADPGWYHWYQAPVETQAMMIETFDEVARDEQSVEEMKIWLLKQKQTRMWRSSRATLEACYALLLRGTDLLNSVYNQGGGKTDVTITVGRQKIEPAKMMDLAKEAGTGYFSMTWQGDEIKPAMGQVKVSKPGSGIAWGALYWQYFEDLDKITPAKTPLQINRKLFVEQSSSAGPMLKEIQNSNVKIQMSKSNKTDNFVDTSDFSLNHSITQSLNHSLKIGDKLIVRIVLSVDRDLEFVHLKDLRASAAEPLYVVTLPASVGNASQGKNYWSGRSAGNPEALSGYRFQDGLGYYQSTTDLATNFFFEYLPKGTYVFEYPLRINAAGDYSTGITTAQCLYAPEFSAHSEGLRIEVR